MNLGSFSILFIALVLIITFFTLQPSEGFQTLHIPESPVAQKNLVEGTTEEYAPSYISDTGPAPGAIASFNSLPYVDPTQAKVKYERVLNLQTTLQAFLEIEAPHLAEMSDPAIQLPLSVARSDVTRLNNEVLVLKRNPGIDSTITQGDMDEIQANLAYLQKKWRLSANQEIEGFADASGSHISQRDLQSLINKIDTTIANLSAYGTNDPIVLARVNVLKQIKAKVQAILNDLISGSRTEYEIPIKQDAYNSFLKTISDVNKPVTSLFGDKDTSGNTTSKTDEDDESSGSLVKEFIDKYSDDLFKGISWDLDIKYMGEAEKNLANRLADNISMENAHVSTQPASGGEFADTISNLQNKYFGSTQNEDQERVEPPGPATVGPAAAKPAATGSAGAARPAAAALTKPEKFDWKTRAATICDNIHKQELDPSEFACLRPDQKVSDDFSWRGYAKMICSRLATSYDTGLPETCGCPPVSWAGWKS